MEHYEGLVAKRAWTVVFALVLVLSILVSLQLIMLGQPAFVAAIIGLFLTFAFLFTAFYGFCVRVPKRTELLELKTWKGLSDAAKVLCLDSRQDSITLRRQIEAFITRNEGAKFVWVAPGSMVRSLRRVRLMKENAGAMEGGPKPKDRGGAGTKAHERPRKGPHGEVVTPEPGRIARTKSGP